MSIEISAVACSSCNIGCCREEGELLYVPVPMSVVQEAIDKAQNDKFSLIVNISMTPEPGSPELSTSPCSITDVGTIDERKNKLCRQLETRRTPGELKELGILKSSSAYQSGSILRKTHDLERARVGNVLSKKLKMRPNKEDLVLQNILKESSVEPFVNFAHKKLKRRRLENQIDHFIANRPSPGSIPENIMHNAISPTLLSELSMNDQPRSDMNAQQLGGLDVCVDRSSQKVPSPPPLPATISIDNKIRRAVTTTESIVKSGGFIFHETQPSTQPSTSQVANDDIRNKQQAVLDKIKPATISLDEEVSSIYQKMTVPDLKAICRQAGFQVRQKATKTELIGFLMNSEKQKKSPKASQSKVTNNSNSLRSTTFTSKPPAIKTLPKISHKEIEEIMSRTPSLSINSPITSPMPRVAQQSYFQSAESTPTPTASIEGMNTHQQLIAWNYSTDNILEQPRNQSTIAVVNQSQGYQQQQPSMQLNVNSQRMLVDQRQLKRSTTSESWQPVARNPLMSSSMSPEPSSVIYSDTNSVFTTNDLEHVAVSGQPYSVQSQGEVLNHNHNVWDKQEVEDFEVRFSQCLQSVAAESCNSPGLSITGLDVDDFLSCNSPFGSTLETCNY